MLIASVLLLNFSTYGQWDKPEDRKITTTNNVGIGTKSPEAKLHIENPVGINGTWLKFTEGVVDYRISTEDGRLKIRQGTNDRLVIGSAARSFFYRI